jgi:triosephosphate isomerase (TIM)
MRKKIAAANWKMHKTPADAREFFIEFKKHVPVMPDHCDVVFFIPALIFGSVSEIASPFAFGPQNIFHEKEGAFTGENSAAVAEVMGATFALVGHSERRQLFGEGDDFIARKVAFACDNRLTPMLCVGETLAEREAGRTNEVVARQLTLGLSLLKEDKNFVIAYEPVWAIGTGKVASPEQAEDAHLFLRQEIKRLRGESVASKTAILYGGSVKPDNAATLMAKANIDGFLVGGASLKPSDFATIVKQLGC